MPHQEKSLNLFSPERRKHRQVITLQMESLTLRKHRNCESTRVAHRYQRLAGTRCGRSGVAGSPKQPLAPHSLPTLPIQQFSKHEIRMWGKESEKPFCRPCWQNKLSHRCGLRASLRAAANARQEHEGRSPSGQAARPTLSASHMSALAHWKD